MVGIKMHVSDGVWLKQTAVAAAESAFFSGSPDPQEFNVNHVHFQKPRENNRRRNSKSPHANQGQNKESNPSGGFDRKRTVSFGDTISEELSGRIKQLETENTALHKTTEELEHKVVQLLERVKILEGGSVAAN